MDFEQELKRYLDMEGVDFGNTLIYMKQLGIMQNRENIKLFITLLKLSHSKGYVDGIKFAKESREDAGLTNDTASDDIQN